LGGKVFQIFGAYGVTVACGSGEGRDVAIGGDRLGEDTAGGVEQVCEFLLSWSYLKSAVFDDVACVFKGQDEGRCSHAEMIDPEAKASLILGLNAALKAPLFHVTCLMERLEAKPFRIFIGPVPALRR
jgi:hypothetical protein